MNIETVIFGAVIFLVYWVFRDVLIAFGFGVFVLVLVLYSRGKIGQEVKKNGG